MTTNTSEVAALRNQIAAEHEAACWALHGLASGTAQHAFINARMARIDAHHARLAALVGEEKSITLVAKIFENSPPQASSNSDGRKCAYDEELPCPGYTSPGCCRVPIGGTEH